MTYTLAAGMTFETQGLDLVSRTDNAAQVSVVSTPLTGLPDSFGYVAQLAGNASQGAIKWNDFGNSANELTSVASPSANYIIWHGYFRWSDVTPATEYAFWQAQDDWNSGSTAEFELVLETDGDIRVLERAGTLATITTPVSVDTWHFFEIRIKPDVTTPTIQIWIDGSEVLSETNGSTASDSHGDYKSTHIYGPTASSGNMFFAGNVVFINSTAATDRITGSSASDRFEWIGPYQCADLNSATPDTGSGGSGDNLDSSTVWQSSGETPFGDTNYSEYTNTPRDGAVYTDSGSRAGPSGDSRVDGDSNIKGAMYCWRALRGTGGGSTHTFYYGNATDGFASGESWTYGLVTGARAYRAVSEAANTVPLSTQNFMLGFGVSGAQDITVYDQAAFLLHVPSGTTTQGLTAGFVTTEESFPAPTITTGAVTLTAGLMASEEAFFAPSLAAALSASLVTTEEAFFAPTVTVGAVTLTPAAMATEEAFFAATVTPGAVALTAPLLASEEAFFAPTVTPSQTLTATLLTTEEAFFAPAVSVGAVTLTPALVATEEAFFAATVAGGSVTLVPGLSASEEAFFAATVAPGAVTLTPAALATEEAFYAATVSQAGAPQALTASLVTTEEAFFAATVAGTAANVAGRPRYTRSTVKRVDRMVRDALQTNTKRRLTVAQLREKATQAVLAAAVEDGVAITAAAVQALVDVHLEPYEAQQSATSALRKKPKPARLPKSDGTLEPDYPVSPAYLRFLAEMFPVEAGTAIDLADEDDIAALLALAA